ncbi:MAG: hypothetical protein CL613_01420 [Aquimarina sp.]|nr:hypothetical protein [Aquimarina sp.]
MFKNVLNIGAVKVLSKSDQKLVTGGDLSFPGGNCCSCVFRPAGSPYQVFITQSCSDPCPQDGATEYQDTGC